MEADFVARLHSTSGGSSETELNELAVMPINWPDSVRVVITVTPVANWLRASRKAVASKFGGLARFIGMGSGSTVSAESRRQTIGNSKPDEVFEVIGGLAIVTILSESTRSPLC